MKLLLFEVSFRQFYWGLPTGFLKLWNEPLGPLSDKGMKALLKENKEMAEKFNEFCAFMFTMENGGLYQCSL